MFVEEEYKMQYKDPTDFWVNVIHQPAVSYTIYAQLYNKNPDNPIEGETVDFMVGPKGESYCSFFPAQGKTDASGWVQMTITCGNPDLPMGSAVSTQLYFGNQMMSDTFYEEDIWIRVCKFC
ncbi:hypothetical protein [Bartonella sp. DGB2]|uniref:hypothetical protein n=1 Tax=Bartonella sp. DGB2 TaxID=3388426 RepID=UPI00398F8F88